MRSHVPCFYFILSFKSCFSGPPLFFRIQPHESFSTYNFFSLKHIQSVSFPRSSCFLTIKLVWSYLQSYTPFSFTFLVSIWKHLFFPLHVNGICSNHVDLRVLTILSTLCPIIAGADILPPSFGRYSEIVRMKKLCRTGVV